MLVDDLALERAHRFQRNRAPIVNRGRGSLICRGSERDSPALAVAGGIYLNPLASLDALECGSVGEVLDCVDRLAVMANQQTQVVAEVLGTDALRILAHVDRRGDAHIFGDPLQEILDADASLAE